MKWFANAPVRKILAIIGYTCIAAYFVLTLLEACSIPTLPKAAANALMGVAFLCQGLTQEGKKKIWGYSLAAGWFIVAVMYCF